MLKIYACLYFILSVILIDSCMAPPKEKDYRYIDLSPFEDGIHHWELYSNIRSTQRLDTTDITGIADNFLAYQNADGGWPKNIDWLAVIDPDSVIADLSEHYRQSTFDNNNTWPQIGYLASVFEQTGIEKYKQGARRGLQYILDNEYPGGGWRGWDADAITFNDNVMTGIMRLLLDIRLGHKKFNWLEDSMRNALMDAYARGLEVILKCQIVIDGQKTAWCQQHDPVTFKPVQGRSYEHPSVTARESSDILLFLMDIPDPDSAVCEAINAGVSWLESAKIEGYNYRKIPVPPRPYHQTMVDYDQVLVPDPTAKPVWARYYDLEACKPFLSRRSGIRVFNLSDVSFERRIGYAWYGYWPEEVFRIYSEWRTTGVCRDM